MALGVPGATRSLSTRDAAACSRGLVTLHGPVAQHPMLPHVRPYCSAVKQGPELHCTASHQSAPCHHSLLQAASHHTAPCHAASACSPPASTTAQQPAPPHTNLHLNLTKLHCTAPDATALPQRAANCTAPNFAGLHQTSPDRTKLHPSALKQPALHQLSPHSSLCERTGVSVCTQSSAVAKSHLAVTKCHRHRADVQHSRKGWSVFVSVNHD